MDLPKAGSAAVLLLAGVLSAHDTAAFSVASPAPLKWGAGPVGTAAAVTWSLVPTGTGCVGECPNAPTGSFTDLGDFLAFDFHTELERAFGEWSKVANVTFTEVGDQGLPFAFSNDSNSGEIRIGGHDIDGAGQTLAHSYYPGPNSSNGDIHFDTSENWGTGGFSFFLVALHEIGHAIGLLHPGDTPELGPFVDAPSLMDAIYVGSRTGLLPDDIAGAAYLYGAPTSVPLPPTIGFLAAGLAVFAVRRRSSVRV
jgi:hypothetical protein